MGLCSIVVSGDVFFIYGVHQFWFSDLLKPRTYLNNPALIIIDLCQAVRSQKWQNIPRWYKELGCRPAGA